MRKHFENISDPRQAGKISYNLQEIIIMTVCAVISGCEFWEDTVDFCRVKESWFRKKLGLALKNGVASYDTFQRVFQLIKPEELEASFMSWVRSIAVKIKGEIISIDGKTVCRSRDTQAKAIHMVSAWANSNQLVLGQVKTEEKSNEITAIPALLDLLELKQCVVTTDAMGCQKDIARKIVKECKSDYVFGLKGNRETLHEDVKLYFESMAKSERLKEKTVITKEKDHGRIETREYYLETEIDRLYQRPDWIGLNAIGMVKSKVWEKGVLREETRYFITSLTDVKAFAKAVRAHWGVENSLHYVLDVTFKEDGSRIRSEDGAENMATLRRLALNFLNNDREKGTSVKNRRMMAAFDDEVPENILGF